MYILTIKGKESKGAYSVVDQDNEQVLYMFENKDDATRYALQLEDRDYPQMRVMEIEDEMMIKSCEVHGHKYAVITPDDIVVPPKNMLSALVEDVLANSDAGSSLFTTQGFFDWAAGQDWVDSNDYGFNIQNLFDGMDVDATGFPEETTNYFMNEDNSEQNVAIIELIEKRLNV